MFNLNGEIFKSEEAYRWGYSSYQVFASDASEEVAFIYEAEAFNMVKEFAFNAAEKRRWRVRSQRIVLCTKDPPV